MSVAPTFSVALKKSSSKFSLPLNIRCSNRCAKPVLPGFSFFDPTWYQVFTATMGALWSSCTSTVRPFLSTNFVYLMSGMGMLTLLAAACCGKLFFGAGFGWAMRVNDPAVTNINDSVRRAILCMNLLLNGASILTIEPGLGLRQQIA